MTLPVEQWATPEECVLIHHFLTGHDCGGGGGYASCKCGKEWHYPITAEEQAEYEQGVNKLELLRAGSITMAEIEQEAT